MQLRNARLCLDCEEIHDAQHCPVCASESFAFMTRWVPAPERRTAPRTDVAAPAEALDTYRQMLTPAPPGGASWKLVKGGALGLAAFGMARWLWQQKDAAARDGGADPRQGARPTQEPPRR